MGDLTLMAINKGGIGITNVIGEENFGLANRKESHRYKGIGEIIVISREDLEFADGESLADRKKMQAARAVSAELLPMEEIAKRERPSAKK